MPPWRVSVFCAQHLGGWVLVTLLRISVRTVVEGSLLESPLPFELKTFSL